MNSQPCEMVGWAVGQRRGPTSGHGARRARAGCLVSTWGRVLATGSTIGGPVKPEPVASHGPELGEGGDQGGLGGHDPGGHAGGDGGVGGREREPANRTAEAVAGLDQLPKQQLSVAGPAASVDAHRVHPPLRIPVGCLLWVLTSSGGPGGRGWSPSERRPVGGAPCVLQPVDQHLEAGGEPLVAVVDPDVLAEGDQGWEAVGGQRSEELVQLGSDRCGRGPAAR